MENNLDNAKKYLVETNFEFFTQSEQNVIGKTMVAYSNYVNTKQFEEKNLITIDKKILKENESFFSVISKIDNF